MFTLVAYHLLSNYQGASMYVLTELAPFNGGFFYSMLTCIGDNMKLDYILWFD